MTINFIENQIKILSFVYRNCPIIEIRLSLLVIFTYREYDIKYVQKGTLSSNHFNGFSIKIFLIAYTFLRSLKRQTI